MPLGYAPKRLWRSMIPTRSATGNLPPVSACRLRCRESRVRPRHEVARVLCAIDYGDPAVAERLPQGHDELRSLSAWKMRKEKPGQTLQATGNRSRLGTGSFFGPFRTEKCACPLPAQGDSPIFADFVAMASWGRPSKAERRARSSTTSVNRTQPSGQVGQDGDGFGKVVPTRVLHVFGLSGISLRLSHDFGRPASDIY